MTDAALEAFATTGHTGACNMSTGVGSTKEVKYQVRIFTNGLVTAEIARASSGDLSISAAGTMDVSFQPFGDSLTTITSNGSTTASYSDSVIHTPSSCTSGTSISHPDYPGVVYYLVSEEVLISSSHASGNFSGDLESDGSGTLSVTVGSDTPVASADGPLVGGIPVTETEIGDTVTFTNTSYDPDDSPSGMDPLAGICRAIWTVTAPNGTQTVYDSAVYSGHIAGISFSSTQVGPYHVELTVQDNEGEWDSTGFNLSFQSGEVRKPEADEGKACGSDSILGASVTPGAGNTNLTLHDPIRTRGYPLTNNISINSQRRFVSIPSFVGKATFTYGIGVHKVVNEDSVEHYFVQDGDGYLLDFGPTSSAPAATDGVFSILSTVTGGYELTNAGAPGKLERSGGFTYEFDSDGMLTTLIDPSGLEQELTYNGSGKLTQVLDVATNNVVTYEYNTAGYISKIRQNDTGAITTIAYAPYLPGGGSFSGFGEFSTGYITNFTVKDAALNIIREYDITYNSSGLPVTLVRDSDSATMLTFTYQDGGNGVWLGNISWPGGGTNYDYFATPPSGVSFRTARTNSNSGVTNYDYDIDYNLLEITYPTPYGASSAPTETMTYDSDGSVVTWTNGATSWTFTYDALGQPTHAEDQTGRYRTFTWSGTNLTEIEDNIGTLVEYTYGNMSLPHTPTVITDGDGNDWTFSHNASGQITTITPPSGSPTGAVTITYDETSTSDTYGYPLTVTNAEGDELSLTGYSLLGDLTETETSPSTGVTNTSTYSYDASQRMTETEHPDGKTMQYNYTGRDLTEEIDEAGTSTEYTHCPTCGKITGVDMPLSKSVSWNLDSDFDTTGFVNPYSFEFPFEYGSAKELKAYSVATSTYKHLWTYDDYFRVKTWKYPGSTLGTYSYDGSGRVTGVSYGAGHADNLTYSYNADDTLDSTTFRYGERDYTYTDSRLVDVETSDFSSEGLTDLQTIDYDYNDDQTISAITWKSDGVTVATWTYSYDSAGRIEEITTNFGESVEYAYDHEGKITTQTNGNGTSTEYEYVETRGWLSKITHNDPTPTPFEEYELEYDSGSNTVGNLTEVTELAGPVMTYEYDALYRLTSEARTGTGSYTKTYGYNTSDNLTTVNGSALASYYTYDRLGALGGGSTSTVQYDSAGLIKKINRPSTGIPCSQFLYNSRGELKQQKDCGGSVILEEVAPDSVEI